MCFQDVKEYASALDSLLHSKVALHTSQQHSLQGSGYYFKDWASQNSSALPCAENLIISSLYKLLKSLHKCTCCSQFPQKKDLLRGFQFPWCLSSHSSEVGSLASIVTFMGLGGCTVIFAQLSGQLMCLKQ